MLRDRFKQWHIDTKNRRVNGRAQARITQVSQQSSKIEHRAESSTDLIARTIGTSVEDTEQRRLLSAVSYWYDDAWDRVRRQVCVPSGVSVILNKATDAAFMVTQNSNRLPWEVLNQIATELMEISWADLHPHRLMKLLRFFIHWQLAERSADEMNIFPLLRLLLKKILIEKMGPYHPLVTLLGAAIRENLTVGLCQHMLTLSTLKASEHMCTENLLPGHWILADSRLEMADMLYRFREFKMLDDLLEPCKAIMNDRASPDLFQLLHLLGMSKYRQNWYEEAERLLSEASDAIPSEYVASGIRIAENHAYMFRCRERMSEAAKVLTDALSKYEPNLKTMLDPGDAMMALHCLECTVRDWCTKTDDCEELMPVIRRLSSVNPG